MSPTDAPPFDVAAVRADLPSARAYAYLNAGTFGPLPRAADQAMREHMSASFERGRTRVEDWLRLLDHTRRGFARSFGASEGEIALMHCTTDGVNTVVSGLDLSEGDEVVTTTHEHPGLTAPLEEMRIGNLKLTFAERAVYWMVWRGHNPCPLLQLWLRKYGRVIYCRTYVCPDSLGEPGFFDAAAQGLNAAIVPGQVNLGWRGARGRGRRGGQIQMVQNALDDIGLRDDAQDAQRASTSRALRNVHREDPQQRKSRAPR